MSRAVPTFVYCYVICVFYPVKAAVPASVSSMLNAMQSLEVAVCSTNQIVASHLASHASLTLYERYIGRCPVEGRGDNGLVHMDLVLEQDRS